MVRNGFKVTIYSNDNKKIVLNNADVLINVDNEDEWVRIENNSVLGYDIILLKIKNLLNNEEKYLFAKSVNIIAKNNEIVIENFSNIEFYTKSEQSEIDPKEIKEINKTISALFAKKKLGFNFDSLFYLNELQEQSYILKLRYLHQLEKENNEK